MAPVLRIAIIALVVTAAWLLARAYQELRDVPDYPEVDHAFPITKGFYHYASSLSGWDEHLRPGKIGYQFVNGMFAYNYGGDIGVQHNPLSISQFVLSLIPDRFQDETRTVILTHLDFLLDTAQLSSRGNLLLPFNYDFPVHNQSAPWYSAMAQGQAASAFLWGYRIFSDERYLRIALRLVLAMAEEDIQLSRTLRTGVWLKEYPGYRYQVLDGSLAALAGVYDVYRAITDYDGSERAAVHRLLHDALAGLKANVHCFESPLSGLYFDDSGTLPSVSYYQSNIAWLSYLSRYDEELGAYLQRLRAKRDPPWRRFPAAIRSVLVKQLKAWGALSACVQ